MLSKRDRNRLFLALALTILTCQGCAEISGQLSRMGLYRAPVAQPPTPESIVSETISIEKSELYRQAETERARQLALEIERLQADLRKAEEALIEAESGLAGHHIRADAVSSLAEARIQVERAATRAPWRSAAIEGAREKLALAERQVAEGHFGAALFFVYRADRISQSLSEEAELVEQDGDARIIQAHRVNLRAGPSVDTPVLSVIEAGTPVFLRTRQGDWVLSQVSGGPTGWIHKSLVGQRLIRNAPNPASLRD